MVHNLNRPFEARDKELKDRLEHMAARLEDAVRALNDVAAAVEEEEADVVSHHMRLSMFVGTWTPFYLVWISRASTRPG